MISYKNETDGKCNRRSCCQRFRCKVSFVWKDKGMWIQSLRTIAGMWLGTIKKTNPNDIVFDIFGGANDVFRIKIVSISLKVSRIRFNN